MTVIAWDGDTLAADRRAVCGHGVYSVTKIARVAGCLVGVAGRGDRIREFHDWVRDGARKEDYPKRDRDDQSTYYTAIVIRRGEPRAGPFGEERDIVVERYEDSPLPIIVEEQQHAIGAGGLIARAAMLCGKNAVEACSIACSLEENCGNGIQTLTFEGG
jgi:hypothetical protein